MVSNTENKNAIAIPSPLVAAENSTRKLNSHSITDSVL